MQCRDSSLTVESFLAAVAEGSSDAEQVALSECLQSEIECLKKTGITGASAGPTRTTQFCWCYKLVSVHFDLITQECGISIAEGYHAGPGSH